MLKHHLIINVYHLMDFLLFSWQYFLCCSHGRCFGEFASNSDFDDINTSSNFSSISPLNEALLFLNSFFYFCLYSFQLYVFLKLLSFLLQIHLWHILVWNVLTTCRFFFITTVGYCCKMFAKYFACSTSAIWFRYEIFTFYCPYLHSTEFFILNFYFEIFLFIVKVQVNSMSKFIL